MGILPPAVQSIEEQAVQAYGNIMRNQMSLKTSLFNESVQPESDTIFYVFQKHLEELMPIIYDPGIADSIEAYSEYFMTPQNAAYLSVDHPEQIEEGLKMQLMAALSN